MLGHLHIFITVMIVQHTLQSQYILQWDYDTHSIGIHKAMSVCNMASLSRSIQRFDRDL